MLQLINNWHGIESYKGETQTNVAFAIKMRLICESEVPSLPP